MACVSVPLCYESRAIGAAERPAMHDQSPAGGEGAREASATARARRSGNLALALASLLVALLVLELGFRLATGVPVLELADWRREQVVVNRLGERAIPDPVLGWTLRPHNSDDGHTTIAHGIRRNFEETDVRTGAILAVGDSFTEGWEVEDDESWPAHLENLLATPVVNAGVGGYGTDQIVLRAEQLLPVVQPRVLIVGILEFSIFRAAHSHFGAPKPYFTIEAGELRYHPPPPLEPRRRDFLAAAGSRLRDVLGYSAIADFLLARLATDFWYGSETQQYGKIDVDPVAVTCALLRRLKARADRDGIRMLAFFQHYAPQIIENDAPSANARRVAACATAAGIQVVDQFPSLRAIARQDAKALWAHYVTHGHHYTHMTPKGNQHAARLLAATLAR
jgi:hypothetical protein